MTVTAKPPAGDQLQPREDLITLTIDDVEVSVPKGTLVIRAAELIGVAIPRFCDHPLLDPVGACRQCLVEVPDAGNGRGIPKPQASCTLEVAAGMVVKTQVTSPVADKAQHGNMEFLLVNHPLDCPICDKGGECPLQNQSMSNGYGESRFTDVKRTYPKPVAISPNVLLDRERCVLCARCTRFSEQVAGDPFISTSTRHCRQAPAGSSSGWSQKRGMTVPRRSQVRMSSSPCGASTRRSSMVSRTCPSGTGGSSVSSASVRSGAWVMRWLRSARRSGRPRGGAPAPCRGRRTPAGST